MAPKDYVSRKPTNKQPPAPAKTSFPWVAVVLALILIGAFGGLLYFLNAQPAQPKPVQASPEKKAQESLPDVPEEQWEYIEQLPNAEVQVDVPENKDSGILYQMQCGSFRLEQQAEEMKAKIAFQGLSALVKQSDGKNGLWYRVVLGPYESKRLAEKDRHTIQRAGIPTCQVWRWSS
jgi:cell division protein FtsN